MDDKFNEAIVSVMREVLQIVRYDNASCGHPTGAKLQVSYEEPLVPDTTVNVDVSGKMPVALPK